ncbi:hypothetical protein SCLCIDRAFT_132841 [Scleroderma citrinum Foug A]|uniref:Uncharacterized protein n=1 Tax=Scleroderma citrinum Foug A TaxID=1036808 RepID=A0A0C3D6H8_9AGAM|nr:hypothetical protein SCLCIDRAFT_132841 [Scleroderma citrinum Foug A]
MSDDDFENELDAVDNEPSDEEESLSRENNEDDNTDIIELQMVMQVPAPDASIADLHKSLSMAQRAYGNLCARLNALEKQYNILVSTTHLSKAAKGVDAKTISAHTRISVIARKYVIFYHFWTPDNMFPVSQQPDIDPRSPMQFSSSESTVACARAELFTTVSDNEDDKKLLCTYVSFGRVVCSFRALIFGDGVTDFLRSLPALQVKSGRIL